jgi:hypothetical protein
VNRISFKLISFLLGVTALSVISSTGSVRAQAPDTASSDQRSAPDAVPIQTDAPAVTPTTPVESQQTNSTNRYTTPDLSSKVTPTTPVESLQANFTSPVEGSAPIYAPLQTAEPAATSVTTVAPVATNPTVTPIPQPLATQLQQPQNYGVQPNLDRPYTQKLQADATSQGQPPSESTANLSKTASTPGTLSTSATQLTEQQSSSEQADSSVAQSLEDIEPGRATRGGRSYIGIGGAIGLSGGTGIGRGGFLINSKIGLTRNISVRPSVIIGDDTDFLIPITYDFIIQSADPFEPIPFAPFIGGGVTFTTNGDNDVGFLLTGGVDVPLSQQFVANGAVNAGFFGDTTSIGLSFGVGYTFSGF